MNNPHFSKRIAALSLALTASLLFGMTSTVVAQTEKPNFVVVLVDDMRWDDFGAGGQSFVQTPNIDSLAADGARFVNAFTTTPLCSPSRASFLTGLYTHDHGIVDNSNTLGSRIRELDTFPQHLQKAGYETAFIGKWHMGTDGSKQPGFDYWVSLSGQGANVDPEVTEGDTSQRVEGHVTDIFTDRAVSFLEAGRDRPFLLYFAQKALHPDPRLGLTEGGFISAERHQGMYDNEPVMRSPSAAVPPVDKPALMRNPFDLPPLGLDTATTDATIRKRMEMMTGVDESVGRLLEVLQRTDQLDNTVFVVTSDHGYFYGEHGLNPQRRLAYEESARIAMVIRYPRLIKAGSLPDQMVLNVDLAPTVLNMAGLSVPDALPGHSVVPILAGNDPDWRSSFLIEHYTNPNRARARNRGQNPNAARETSEFMRTSDMGYRAVRTERYKYIEYAHLDGMDELYDLETDPYELENIIDSAAAQPILTQMKTELSRLYQETR